MILNYNQSLIMSTVLKSSQNIKIKSFEEIFKRHMFFCIAWRDIRIQSTQFVLVFKPLCLVIIIALFSSSIDKKNGMLAF